MKALGELCCQVGDVIVLLDGAHDWLSPPPVTLLEATCPPDIESRRWRVKTLVGADHLAAGVAGASVLAKCARDAEMGRLARRHPGYGWERNMGYGTPGHRQAIATLGMSPQHRRTWKLAVE
jgi:ribonuclease HII